MKISVLFLFVLNVSLFAQNLGIWQNYTSMYNVQDIAVNDNYILAATDGGAFRFDAADNSYLTLTKSEGLSSQGLQAVAVDYKNRAWFGSEEGYINVYDPQTGSFERKNEISKTDYPQKGINDFFIVGDTMLVASDIGIAVIIISSLEFRDSFLKFGDFPSGIPVNSINIENGQIIASTDYGVAVQKPGAVNLAAPESWDVYRFSSTTNIPAKKTVKFNGALIAANGNGVWKLNGNSFQPWISLANIKDIAISGDTLYVLQKNSLVAYYNNTNATIFQSSEELNSLLKKGDRFYIGSVNGVYIIENSEVVEGPISPNGPAGNSFENVDISPDGDIWVASGNQGQGIFRYDGSKWINYTNQDTPFLYNNMHYVYAPEDNDVFFGTWGTGYAEFDGVDFELYGVNETGMTGPPAYPDFLVISGIEKDSKNNLWILNYHSAEKAPLSAKINGEWKHYKSTDLVNSDIITELFEIDQYNTKWFTLDKANSISGSRLCYFNENGTYDDTSDDIWGVIGDKYLESSDISSIVVDKRGELWVGTSQGINIIHNPANPLSRIGFVYAMRNQAVTAIAVDPLNRKWVATNEGVYLLSSDGTKILDHYDAEHSPLPSNSVQEITVDDNSGTVYFVTGKSLASLTTEAKKPSETFETLKIYPNPYITGNNNGHKATIEGLIENSSIKIFTVSGKLIAEFSSPGGSIAMWDGTDNEGNQVASGIYIVAAYNEDASEVTTGKIAVIKK